MKNTPIFISLSIALFVGCVQKEQPAGGKRSSGQLETSMDIQENFKEFRWLYEPKHWGYEGGGLQIQPDSGSDFWQRTHYGFRNDNAHFYYTEVTGDFEMYAQVTFEGKNRYDQAGLCVRLDEDNWLKTSAEFETDAFSHLGAVVTNLGYSDWSTQEIPAAIKEMEYKIVRKGQDYEVYARYGNQDFQQIRIAHLHKNDSTVKAGVYACSPTAAGYKARFTKFELKK